MRILPFWPQNFGISGFRPNPTGAESRRAVVPPGHDWDYRTVLEADN